VQLVRPEIKAFGLYSAPFEPHFSSAVSACYVKMDMLKSSFPMMHPKA
jgi:hypothetical protein